jgi:acetyl-CoA carboxylase biotin carboxyl carrier protein
MPEEKSLSALELLQKVCDIMEDRELAEVYLREGELTLRVRRDNPAIAGFPGMHQPPSFVSPQTVPANAPTAPLAHSTPEDGEFIRSPMPGTFFRAPHPEEPPFVEVGATVSEGETVGLIEAMKIFNEIPAPFAGEILEILVEDAEAVEFDQPLFRVKRT